MARRRGTMTDSNRERLNSLLLQLAERQVHPEPPSGDWDVTFERLVHTRFDADGAPMTSAIESAMLDRLHGALRERRILEAETHSNGRVPGSVLGAINALLHPKGTVGRRRAWIGLAVAMAVLGIVWFVLDLPGAPGVKRFIAGEANPERQAPDLSPEVPEPQIPELQEPTGPESEGPLPNEGTPKKAPERESPDRQSKGEGLLAQKVEVGRFTNVMGEPTVTNLDGSESKPALPNMAVTTAMRIETGDADKLELRFNDGTTTSLEFNAAIEIPALPAGSSHAELSRPPEIRLLRGKIWTKVVSGPEPTPFAVRTPVATAEVLGTEFTLALKRTVGASDNVKLTAILRVREGRVAFYNNAGRVEAQSMTESVAEADAAPTEPRRSVRYFQIPRTGTNALPVVSRAKRASATDTQHLAIEQAHSGMRLEDVEGSPQVVELKNGSPAQLAGMLPGDRIVAVNGVAGLTSLDVRLITLKSLGSPLKLAIVRNGQQVSVQLTPTSPHGAVLTDPPKPGDPLYEATWLMIEGNLADAESALQRLLASRSAAGAHNNLGRLYEVNERYSVAIRHYRDAVRLSPSVLLYRSNLADALLRIGNFDRSLEEWTACARLAPDNLYFLAGVTETHQALGNTVEALRTLGEVLEREPYYVRGWLLKSMILMEAGRAAESLACARRAKEISPKEKAVI
jgi:ferric-dicitrate binding protein FerR (iron transport regulator)/Flp pilus assembly protein TadD